MKTEAVRTWPIATRRFGGLMLLGLPQHLGDGQPPRRENFDEFQPLEAVAGADWLEQVLGLMLPRDLVWAWWLPTRIPVLRQLAPGTLPDAVRLQSLSRVLSRRWFWRGMSLAVIPPLHAQAQDLLVQAAGADTEQLPEFIWAASPDLDSWRPTELVAWCCDRSAWGNPNTLSALGANTVVVLFDGDAYCALPTERAAGLERDLREQAARWGLSVIAGPETMAWPDPMPPKLP